MLHRIQYKILDSQNISTTQKLNYNHIMQFKIKQLRDVQPIKVVFVE